MTDEFASKTRGFALSDPGDPLRLTCDALGPSLGPIRLLQKTSSGFGPRPARELDAIMSAALAKPFSSEHLTAGLHAVARALDVGDMTRAIFATQYLQLPDLTKVQSERAEVAERLLKASPDDPIRPGYPKDTPGGKGGQFRPKTSVPVVSARNDLVTQTEKKEVLRRLAARRSIKAGFKALLNPNRLGRLLVEGVFNAVPVLDVIGDAAALKDLLELANEFRQIKLESDAAAEFVSTGPHALEDLYVSQADESFGSFDAFKKIDLTKRFGGAGEGYEYHHIVEQGPNGQVLSQQDLQSTKNIIRIPKLIHELITSEYAKKLRTGGERYREMVSKETFQDQYRIGIEVMRRLGIVK